MTVIDRYLSVFIFKVMVLVAKIMTRVSLQILDERVCVIVCVCVCVCVCGYVRIPTKTHTYTHT